MPDKEIQKVVDKNFEAFTQKLPELLKTHPNKFALLRDADAVEFFDSARDAMVYGQNEFADGLFSVQEVSSEVEDLGYFSHAMH